MSVLKWIQRFGRKQILKRENIYINCDEIFHKNRFCGCVPTMVQQATFQSLQVVYYLLLAPNTLNNLLVSSEDNVLIGSHVANVCT